MSMSERKTIQIQEGMPGPGAHDAHLYDLQMRGSKGFIIGKSQYKGG